MSFTGWLLPFVLLGSVICLIGAQDWPGRAQRLWGALAAAAGALILGRLGFLALNIAALGERPGTWTGEASAGYLAHTAWVGGWLGWRLSGRRVPDRALSVAALLVAVGASLGCAQAGCAYGREIDVGDGLLWFVRVDWPDAYGISNPRIPAQLFFAAWLAGGALVAAFWRNRPQRFDIITVATLWFAVGDATNQLMRADSTPVWLGLRAQIWLDGILVLSAILAHARRRPTANLPQP